jgi:hypothetical protein
MLLFFSSVLVLCIFTCDGFSSSIRCLRRVAPGSYRKTNGLTTPSALLRSKNVQLKLSDKSEPQASTDSGLKLDISLLKPFLDIAVPFFKNDKTARNSLIGVFALTLLNSGVSVAFSYISRYCRLLIYITIYTCT